MLGWPWGEVLCLQPALLEECCSAGAHLAPLVGPCATSTPMCHRVPPAPPARHAASAAQPGGGNSRCDEARAHHNPGGLEKASSLSPALQRGPGGLPSGEGKGGCTAPSPRLPPIYPHIPAERPAAPQQPQVVHFGTKVLAAGTPDGAEPNLGQGGGCSAAHPWCPSAGTTDPGCLATTTPGHTSLAGVGDSLCGAQG